jgi:hypothetical protein
MRSYLADMFLWLRDSMMRLLTLNGTLIVCESRVRAEMAKALDLAFGSSGLGNLDSTSFAVSRREMELSLSEGKE